MPTIGYSFILWGKYKNYSTFFTHGDKKIHPMDIP
jgi:hypothetical protein